MNKRAAMAMLASIGLAVVGGAILAQERKQPAPPAPKANPIRIDYVAPNDQELTSVFQLLKERAVLEKFQEFLSPLRLPEPLLVRFQDCDGDANAWYENKSVTVCYEYVAELLRHAAAGGVSREDAIAGPASEVVLHEIGHAVFDLLKFPVLGREEDAADMFAAYILLNLGQEDARRTMGAIAAVYDREAKEEKKAGKQRDRTAFADEHGLAAQRYFSLLCIAYGGYPDLFQDVVDKGYLPKERAKKCAKEYRQLDHAMKTLFTPHLETALLQGKHRHWLEPPRAAPPAQARPPAD